MKKFYALIANLILVSHFLVAMIIVFGWLVPQIKFFYLAILIIWSFYWLFLGYCPLTRWESWIRKKYGKYPEHKGEFLRHYMKKFFKVDISAKALSTVGILFSIVSLTLNFHLY